MTNPNPNAKPDDGLEANQHADSLESSDRSVRSQIEGGQNQVEGEPQPGYGNVHAQGGRGGKQ